MMLPIRRVARVVIFDAAGAVLLCRYAEAGERGVVSYWVPPGGALESGENYEEAAAREVREETGLEVEPGPELWEGRFEFRPQGRAVDQIERYFAVRLPSVEPAVHNVSTEDIQELRWWSRAALRDTGETVYPEGLRERLSDLLARAGPE